MIMENSFKTPDGLRSRYATTDVEEGPTKQQYDDDDDDENDDAIIIDVYGNHSVEEDRYYHTNNREGNLSCCDSITQYVPFAPIRDSMVRCKKRRCFATTRKGNVSSCRRGIIQQVSSGGVFGCCQVIYNLMMRTTSSSRATAVRATYATVSTPIRSNRRTIIPPSTTMVTSETDEETPPEIEDWTPTPPEPKKPVPSVEVPQLPKLTDYTKSRAKLPDKVPIRIEFCPDWGQDMDDGDDESTTEEDLLLASQGKPTEEKVKFLLRLPNRFPKDDGGGGEEEEGDGQQRKKPAFVRTFSNSSRSNIQGLARTLSSEFLQKQEGGSLLGQKKTSKQNLRDMLKAELQGSSNQGSSSRSNRSNLSINNNNNNNHSNHRHHESQQATNRNSKMNRRGSGDTTGSTSRNIFIAPFPTPLSRENSLEGLNETRGTRPSPLTPTSLRSRSLREKEFVRSMLNGTKSNISLGGSQSERGRYNNGSGDNLLPADTVMLLNDLSGHSDDEKTSGRRRGGGRMNRRGSFVKGSKIERFDGNESQSRMRRALQRREAVKKKQAAVGGSGGDGAAATTTSYAEWKLDLMANG